MSVKKKAAGKKASGSSKKKPTEKKAAAKSASSSSKRMSTKEPQKDPKGGLTEAGRKAFAKKEGAHLKPGVKGPADTPEKMKRKGSFLRRHFANPRGPMEKDGEPTRLALSAKAWGEPVPESQADAKKLAEKGTKLLDAYKKTQETSGSRRGATKKKASAAKKKPAKPAAARATKSQAKRGSRAAT